jgi:hypothetical protein
MAKSVRCEVTPLTERLIRPLGDPVVYCAGPMRHIDKFNFPAFDEARDYVNSLEKYHVISPADVDREEKLELDDVNDVPEAVFETCMRRDLEIVANAHAIFLLKGWEKSRGANNELFVANACGVEVWLAEYDGLGNLVGHTVANAPVVPPLIGGDMSVQVVTSPGTMTGEVRVTDPNTGGAKGQKPAQLGAIDPIALLALARVGGMGAEKYDRFNYLNGYKWSLSFDAALRHIMLMAAGEDFDEESGLPHATHAAWNLLTLTSFLLRKVGTDDRPPVADLNMVHALVQGMPLA